MARLTNHTRIIARNLRKLRTVKGYSQKELAALLNVSFQQFQKYETGKNRISAEKLFLLKNHLNVPYEAFFENVEVQKDNLKIGAERAFLKLQQIREIVSSP